MLTLIENGEVYAPQPAGPVSVLLAGEKVLAVGKVSRRGLDQLKVDYDVIDAAGCVVAPG